MRMEVDEAIRILEQIEPATTDEMHALEMAIAVMKYYDVPRHIKEMERNCSEIPNGSDLISRQAAINGLNDYIQEYDDSNNTVKRSAMQEAKMLIESLPSAEPKTKCIAQIRIDRDDMEDLVNEKVNEIVDKMSETKAETVLCALADRACPFQGKEYAWCLTCPHISEEDRALVKKAVAEPKTGKWELDPDGMDWNIPAWRCSECGFRASYIGVEANGFGNNPMNWAGSKFCPQCGARITGYER